MEAAMRYYVYKTTIRQEKIKPLLDRIVKDASEEEISMLKAFLEWMERQVRDRGKSENQISETKF